MKFQKTILFAAMFGAMPFSTNGADFQVTSPVDDGTGNSADSLSWALLQANTTPEDDVITLTTDIQINQVMKRLVDSNITIQSDATRRTIDGNGQFRPLFIKSGQVTIKDIDVIGGLAKGGDSGLGGAGAGLGGAIFIYDGDVTISNVTISNSNAIGGVSTGLLTDGKGGGGMYGNAGLSSISGGLFGTPYGGYGNYRNIDPWFGGHNDSGWYSGNGGFGGGGPFGNYEDFGGYYGGFGGGGGAGGDSGPGYDGVGALGGFGAGKGSTFYMNGGFEFGVKYSAGAGGSGYGGAIFVRTGNVFLSEVTIQSNTATSSQLNGLGGGLFILNSPINLNNINNRGMPDQIATVSACKLAFVENLSSTDKNTINNNDDLFDEADVINASTHLPANSPCMVIKGNNQLIKSGDVSPNAADHTNFGVLDTNNASSISKTFSLTNLGTVDIELSDDPMVSITGLGAADFYVSSYPSVSTLEGQSSVSFELTFAPTSLGLSTAVVIVGFNNDEVYDFQVSGQAIDSEAEIEVRGGGQTIVDGQVEVGLSDHTLFEGVNNNTFEIHNIGNLDLNLNNNPIVQLVGGDAADFQIISQPNSSVIGPTQMDSFEVRFDPVTPGMKTTKIEILNNDSDEPIYDFVIEGKLIPIMKVYDSTQSMINGSSEVLQLPATPTHGTTRRSKELRIINAGNSALNFDPNMPFEITGLDNQDFTALFLVNAPLTQDFLPPGAEGRLFVTFGPSYYGLREAVLNIYTDDYQNSHFQYPISGLGNFEFWLSVSGGSYLDEGDDLNFKINLLVNGIDNIEPFDVDIPFNYFLMGSGVGSSDFEGIQLSGQLMLPAGQYTTDVINFPTVIDGINEGREKITLHISSDHPLIKSQTVTRGYYLDDFDDNDVLFRSGFED